MQQDHTVTVEEAVQVLAMVGDLSMGQPVGQSIRSANLAEQLACADGASAQDCAHTRLVTLQRWSGCTANAAGFSSLLGDDVGGRDALLTQTLPPDVRLTFSSVVPLARIHCEVSGTIAGMMGMPAEVETGLRCVWEHFDGGGMPERLSAPLIPRLVYYVNLAGDLEILSRAHGLDEALNMIASRADKKYPAVLTRLLLANAREWLDAADLRPCASGNSALESRVPLNIVADMIELKLPWLLGYSRSVANLAERAAALAGLSPEDQRCIGRAALIHGIGRAGVPNMIWERDTTLGVADWEKVRLAPYWTARAGTQIPSLRAEMLLASQVYERLDGSGYFRDLAGNALGTPQRVLAAAAAYAALRMPRPWREAHSAQEATRILSADAAAGRFDADAVNAVIAAAGEGVAVAKPAAQRKLLSERETDVLRRVSLGESNKVVASKLQISPSTVGTHVENILRKLGCTTRTAATLKGLNLGLI